MELKFKTTRAMNGIFWTYYFELLNVDTSALRKQNLMKWLITHMRGCGEQLKTLTLPDCGGEILGYLCLSEADVLLDTDRHNHRLVGKVTQGDIGIIKIIDSSPTVCIATHYPLTLFPQREILHHENNCALFETMLPIFDWNILMCLHERRCAQIELTTRHMEHIPVG